MSVFFFRLGLGYGLYMVIYVGKYVEDGFYVLEVCGLVSLFYEIVWCVCIKIV